MATLSGAAVILSLVAMLSLAKPVRIVAPQDLSPPAAPLAPALAPKTPQGFASVVQ